MKLVQSRFFGVTPETRRKDETISKHALVKAKIGSLSECKTEAEDSKCLSSEQEP